MGMFSGLFKKKEKNNVEVINNNGVDNQVVANEVQGQVASVQVQVVQNNVQPVVSLSETPVAMNSQSSVLEQMQNKYVEEVAQEEAIVANEPDAMSIFNQNIELDGNNPMAIFGVESEENSQPSQNNQ